MSRQPKWPIVRGISLYITFFILMLMLIQMSMIFSWFPIFFPLMAYFIFGFVLNRMVLRTLIEWMAVDIDSLSSGKLRSFLFWPITYPILFFKLLVIEHL